MPTVTYERRRPEQTTLYQVVRENLHTLYGAIADGAYEMTAAIVDARGKRLGSHVSETNGDALVRFLTTQPGKMKICMEEGAQSE